MNTTGIIIAAILYIGVGAIVWRALRTESAQPFKYFYVFGWPVILLLFLIFVIAMIARIFIDMTRR